MCNFYLHFYRRVVEEGSHEELLSLRGKYYGLWTRQNME